MEQGAPAEPVLDDDGRLRIMTKTTSVREVVEEGGKRRVRWKRVHPGPIVPNNAQEPGCWGQDLPPVKKTDENGFTTMVPAFFLNRREYFCELEHARATQEVIEQRVFNHPKRSPSLGLYKAELETTVLHRFDAPPSACNEPAPEKPKLAKGQKWVVVRHRPPVVFKEKKTKKIRQITRTVLCAPSE
jgi:hypothetical protein